jgi:hypothetical protein
VDEKRCQMLQKESHPYHPYIPRLIAVRPVPQLEITYTPSDDELGMPGSPTNQRAQTRNSACLSPAFGDEHVGDLQFQDEERRRPELTLRSWKSLCLPRKVKHPKLK